MTAPKLSHAEGERLRHPACRDDESSHSASWSPEGVDSRLQPDKTGRDRRDLVIFHRARMDREERASVERDRGVAVQVPRRSGGCEVRPSRCWRRLSAGAGG